MVNCPARIMHKPFAEPGLLIRCLLPVGHGGEFHETEFRGDPITWPTSPPPLVEPLGRPRPEGAPPDPRTREEREAERQRVFDNPLTPFPFEFEDVL